MIHDQHAPKDKGSAPKPHAIEQIQDTLWACDLNLKLTYANSVGEKNTGISAAERKKTNIAQILAPESIATIIEPILQALNAHDSNSKVLSKNRTKDGRTLFCEWYNSPVNDSTGKIITAISIVRDITAEHQAQQVLRHRDAEQLSINTLLQSQQHMLAKSITPRIKLIYDLTENLWPVYLDGGDLLDAILNISINAMHAMSDGGQLSIASYNEHVNEFDAPLKGLPKGDYVLLSISDTGCGMDKETQEKIFGPFFSTKGELGTGLGLSQVYGFVERSKGSIRIYSEPEHGTHIRLYFPRHHDIDSRDNSEAQVSTTPALGGQETILVVDDEIALLNLSSELLRQQGYKVIPVASGQQALEVLKSTPANLLLSDVIMPEMDGYQLAATVQAQYPEVKIQLASGFTDNRHTEKLSANLIDNIIQKPFNIRDMLTRIRSLLDE
ncbi:MAG: response regulator [Candidatus Reddybacter sp.]